MRKILLAALAATALVPTAASAQRHNHMAARGDWRTYRQTHRNVFTRPAFVWPRGYSYRPLSVGAVLDRLFWGPQYRISYATYRLPYPGPGREWVRYGNDAVLISIRTGRVITVYTDFFY
ncbi:MAG: RcnB family protein [Porphyrobacter sp.]|nr:RcnB family protein [Porphyrobacter sp.]